MIPFKDLETIYSNEQLFLLLICRIYFSASDIADFNNFIASHPQDWQLLYKMARAHGIRPFVYHVMTKYNLAGDATFLSKLEKDNQIALQRNMMKAVVSSKITNDLKKQSITLINYKGSVLAAQYYENLGMRESVDIDFIASRRDIAVIEDYFIANGYIAKETVPRRYLEFYKIFFKDIVYTLPKYKCNIEIHWSLLNRFTGNYPSFDFFLPHIRPHYQNNTECTVLSPTYDFLAIISNHLVKDMGTRFKYIIDIACILKKHPELLTEPDLLTIAGRYGFKKRLVNGLSVVSSLTGVAVGPDYSTKVTQEDLKIPLQYPIELRNFQFNSIHFLKRSLALQDNVKYKIGLLTRSFFYFFIPSYIDINTFRLPVYVFPLLVILRPFRLLFEKMRSTTVK
ncbi:nucleotidyltransferase family protein [Mucilaginibacter sp. L3T2-6]|uniref:nucleotidyltransferase domain-containing protein n=1 Tax=Mucilaginibacter sp. L3T2-6 TaxID=3062491 RepID=UPI00267741F4|nr:nucleotidyltransferase family protein [Mucilaginibacter sp. L3T2-6]MDO3642254.1 nucleotidyltransferase family protein [Mucilaginibacter sp. L3T2-6]MDV6214749.1 nucleotidyltransferase family protein [Mucilaginibacter sp. L3T2-6]